MKIGYLQNIVIRNLFLILKFYNIKTPKDAAYFLNINYSTLRSWMSFERQPSLKKLDKISNILKIPTYSLFLSNLDCETIKQIIEQKTDIYLNNNSHFILCKNLQNFYKCVGRNSWNDIVSLYLGLLSEDTLKSYHRKENYITPSIPTLDKMCSYLGIPAYKLLRGDNNEE